MWTMSTWKFSIHCYKHSANGLPYTVQGRKGTAENPLFIKDLLSGSIATKRYRKKFMDHLNMWSSGFMKAVLTLWWISGRFMLSTLKEPGRSWNLKWWLVSNPGVEGNWYFTVETILSDGLADGDLVGSSLQMSQKISWRKKDGERRFYPVKTFIKICK